MGVDPAQWEIETVHFVGDEGVESVECFCGGPRVFIVSEEDDSDVSGVVVFDMGPLEGQGACLPCSACGVDGVVVSDVGPAVVEMPSADDCEATDRIGVSARWQGADGVVVDGDSRNTAHRIGKAGFGFTTGPGGAWDDEVWELG